MSLRKPTVTALVPSYNHGPYLYDRIQSIIKQTYQHIQLVVIDDCSNDESHEIIGQLQTQYGFQYIRNERNSGTPFAAWERICNLAAGDYIWICESDDVADPSFLDTAVNALESNKKAVIFYCNSWIIDSEGRRIDHTKTYFQRYSTDGRWSHDFVLDGMEVLINYQLQWQTVPNMSSALIATKAFRTSYNAILKKFRLAGDWLFLGNVMRHGDVLFSALTLNKFRRHSITSRERVKQAAEHAEYVMVTYYLFRATSLPIREFATAMTPLLKYFWLVPEQRKDAFKTLLKISQLDTFLCLLLLLISILSNPKWYKKLYRQISLKFIF